MLTKDPTASEAAESEIAKLEMPGKQTRQRRPMAVGIRTLVAVVAIVLLAASLLVAVWQWNSKSNEVDGLQAGAADNARAEKIAIDYAVGAANMDFNDLPAWEGRLTNGTTPELANKLKQAAASMDQIITPLQWTSTSVPIAATVSSESNGVYKVDCFVSVLTKNSQAPDGVQSTATYRLSIDSSQDWVITEVGGIESSLGTR